jgi:hypothetical protein
MYNSTIKPKLKPCKSCGLPSRIFSRGRCRSCARREDYKPIKKVSENKKEEISVSGGSELDRWFADRRKEMIGFCANCGKKSEKHSDKYFKFSIAHILPKAYFKSVATRPDNWIELCFWGDNSCHTQMDNKMLDLVEMSCWNEIVIKFQKIYPHIAPNEKRRIPDVLLQYLGTDM